MHPYDGAKEVGLEVCLLSDSIGVFQQKNIQLNRTKDKLLGLLPWHRHMDARFSSDDIMMFKSSSSLGAILFEPPLTDKEEREVMTPQEESIKRDLANGLILGSGTSGYCVGYLDLPKDSVWNILITVLLAVEEVDTVKGNGGSGSVDGKSGSKISESNREFENDFVSVRLGTDLGSMSQVGMCYNKINKETGTVLYDVKHIMKGKTLAFRFDFSTASGNRAHRLAVETGNKTKLILLCKDLS